MAPGGTHRHGPANERFNAKVIVRVENVRHHIRDEEHDLFPEVRTQLGREALVELGEQLQKAKRLLPLAGTRGLPTSHLKTSSWAQWVSLPIRPELRSLQRHNHTMVKRVLSRPLEMRMSDPLTEEADYPLYVVTGATVRR